MMHPYALAGLAAGTLRRALAGGAPLLLVLLLPWVARAQAPTVQVVPAGPLTPCAGSPQTLTATATVPGFNVAAGQGFDSSVNAIVAQADGKVLVGGAFVGYSKFNDNECPNQVARLNADGSLDTSFNNGGLGISGAAVYALAVQPDGKVLVGGNFDAYNDNAAAPDNLLRLNADGSLDTSFNPGGAGPGGSGYNNRVLALAVQPDGKVLVGGKFTTYNGKTTVPGALLRLNTDGSVDPSFNPGGAGVVNSLVYALALQPDGKVLVGGNFGGYNNFTAPYLVRLNPDGLPDASFNNGGTGLDNDVYALAVQPDGKVLVGGDFTRYNGNVAAPDRVLRLTASGALDPGFNNGSPAGTDGTVLALLVQPDGKVLVGGICTAYNGNAAAPDGILRLTASGALDTGFNSGGAGADSQVNALAVQPDGKILLAGVAQTYNGSRNVPRNLVCLNADGSPNNAPTVPAGLAYTWNNGATGPSISVSQPGDYQATATTATNGPGYSNVVRLNAPPAVAVQLTPAGPLALPPGGSATLTATATLAAFRAGSGFAGTVRALLVQPDGKVLVGGDFAAYNGSAAPANVLRLNADGTLDTGFNGGAAGTNGSVYALALQPDGKVLVAGAFTTYNGSAAPANVLRLTASGALDPAFNPGGAGANGAVRALAVQLDGRVLVGGDFTAYNGNAAAPDRVVRLTTGGALDATFNPGRAGANNTVRALAVQANGQVLVGGDLTNYNNNGSGKTPLYLLRINADGTLDINYNTRLSTSNSLTGPSGRVAALVSLADGRVLVGGSFTDYNGYIAPDNVLRINANGTLDQPFNNRGNVAGTNGPVAALLVQPDGQVLVGGDFTAYNGDDAATPDDLVRLNTDGSPDPNFNPGGAGGSGAVAALAGQAAGQFLVGGDFAAYNAATAPAGLLRVNADGTLNDVASPLAGATFVMNPGNTAGNTRTVSEAGTYTALAADPASGCPFTSNAVTVTTQPLPVELTAFTATAAGPAAVRLAWATASEKNSLAFEVERSLDGVAFARIGAVAAAGSSRTPRTYTLRDAALPAGAPVLYYRLRQLDQDGTATYSPVQTVRLTGAATGLALFPNPTHGGPATLTGAQPGTAVQVLDALGRPVLTALADAAGTAALALPAGLAAGVYVVRTGSQALRLTVE